MSSNYGTFLYMRKLLNFLWRRDSQFRQDIVLGNICPVTVKKLKYVKVDTLGNIILKPMEKASSQYILVESDDYAGFELTYYSAAKNKKPSSGQKRFLNEGIYCLVYGESAYLYDYHESDKTIEYHLSSLLLKEGSEDNGKVVKEEKDSYSIVRFVIGGEEKEAL